MNFKQFLLTENKADLGIRIGDILNSLEDLSQEIDKKGKSLTVFAEDIVARIQAIIRADWPRDLKQYLVQIRNAVLVICKSLDGSNKMPLPEAIKVFQNGLKKVADGLGTPITDIGTPPSKQPEEKGIDSSQKVNIKAVIPQSVKLTNPVSPGGPPPEPEIPLGGSTGPLTNL
jgi:hypothetical protein